MAYDITSGFIFYLSGMVISVAQFSFEMSKALKSRLFSRRTVF